MLATFCKNQLGTDQILGSVQLEHHGPQGPCVQGDEMRDEGCKLERVKNLVRFRRPTFSEGRQKLTEAPSFF